MKTWIIERDNYTQIQLFTKYFSSKKYIFIIEVEQLHVQAENLLEYEVMVRNYKLTSLPMSISLKDLQLVVFPMSRIHFAYCITDDLQCAGRIY